MSAASAWMFPWEKRQMDGGNQPLRTWEKIYWGVFVTGFAVFLLTRVAVWSKTEPEDPAVSCPQRPLTCLTYIRTHEF